MPDRSVTLLVVLLLVLGAAAPVGALVADARESGADAAAVQPENGTTNDTTTFGASVSAFVQTSAADAEGEVDDGVFTARFESASNETRETLVRERTDRLADRIDRLRDRRAALLNTTGNLTVAERARAARLAAQIDSLERTLNVTEDAARTAGVNGTRLATLRENASELDGPEVAEIARGIAGGPDRARGNGPPDGVAGNRTDGPGEGPPEDAAGNRTDGDGDPGNGPPEGDRGQGNASGDGEGPPEDAAGNRTDGDGDPGNGPPEGDRGQGDGSDDSDDDRAGRRLT